MGGDLHDTAGAVARGGAQRSCSTIAFNDANVNRPAPAQPASAPGKADPAVDAYRRAIQARPTGFSDDPFRAAARTMDRLGQAAGKLFSRSAAGAQAGNLQALDTRLSQAVAAAKANPGSTEAKQQQMVAAARMMQALQAQNPGDPRINKLAAMLVRLSGQLGPQALPLSVPGLDMRGLLGMAAQLVSRFGSPQGMQQAMALEQVLQQGRAAPSAEVLQLLTQIAQQNSISKSVLQALLRSWQVTIAQGNRIPDVDLSARTISINASQMNASLAVLAKAFWIDQQLMNPHSRDGFVGAFLKAINTGKYAELARKYRQQRILAEANDAARGPGAVERRSSDDETADMFATLVSYASSDEDLPPLPGPLQEQVDRFLLSV